jgi:hypothetical protein
VACRENNIKVMSEIGKLKEEIATLDLLIEAHSQLLEQVLQRNYGMCAEQTLRYPTSLSEMRAADENLQTLYAASSKVSELCWQREIKKEILRLLNNATASSDALTA